MRRRTALLPVAVGAVSLVATAFAPAANAAQEEVVGGLVTPLSVAVADDGTVYASQNFAGKLTKKAPDQEAAVVYEAPGSEVGAVSVSGDVVTFATTGMGPKPSAKLWTMRGAESTATVVANLWGYERKNNPDGNRKYGVIGLSKSCIASIPKKMRHGLVAYKGVQESHPYATYVAGGTTYVADAAANAIFSVTDAGVSTVAVLPATKIEVTKKIRKAFGLPKCVQGKTFRAEPVPTDVEMGPDGNLYVTSLPGGPEDPSMGANGAVYRVNPTSGAVQKTAGGLLSPVGIAIEPNGTAYVSMLFPSVIMKQPLGGEPVPFAEVPFPGDVEYKDGFVYATETDLMNEDPTAPAGKVLRWATAG